MRAAIDAEDHHRIYSCAHFLNRWHDLHTILITECGGEAIDACGALWQIRTTTSKGRNDTRSRDMVRIGRIIQPEGELLGV